MHVRGLYVALVTPMHADGAIDPDAIPGHLDRLIAGGVAGVVALGTTGEFPDLTGAERAAVVRDVVAAVDGRVPVIAGVGAVGTVEATEHARAAADAGADGLLSLPPLYWKLSEAGLLRHFEQVAAATSLPVLLYDFPALSGTGLTPGLVARAAELPGITGIKLSGPELRKALQILEAVKPDHPEFSVMIGAAELIMPAVLAGADGTIAAIANVEPRPLAALLAALADGDVDTAVGAHRDVLRMLAVSGLASPPVLALKAAAHACGSPGTAAVRTQPDAAADVVIEAARLAKEL